MKISIITINYNNKNGLEKTVQSVVNQTYTDFEYIIIDGGSTDESVEIIKYNSKKINYWVSEKDNGVYNAMNKGIKVANGEYLLFLNSGDYLFNSNVLLNVNTLLESNISIYYGNIIYSKNNLPISIHNPPKKLSFSYFLEFSLPHPASFIKRELFENHFYYNENLKIISDWEFFIYCICKKNETYKHIDLTISDFDNSGMSSDFDNFSKIAYEKEQILLNHFPMFFEDSKLLIEINSKRFKQILQIKRNKKGWIFLKLIINVFNLFLPKIQMDTIKYYKKIK